MNGFTKRMIRISGLALLFCMFAGMVWMGSAEAGAQTSKVGTAVDNGISLTIQDINFIDNGQKLKLDYTVHSTENHQIMKNTVRLMQNPHIWIDDMLLRGDSVSFKKIGDHDYRGTIISKLHQYRPANAKATFQTHEILKQKGQWTINFFIKGT